MPFEWIDYDRQRTSLEVVGTNTNNIIFLKEHFTNEINMVNTRIDQLGGDSGAFDRLEEEISNIEVRVENIGGRTEILEEEISGIDNRIEELENKPPINQMEILYFEESLPGFLDINLPPANDYIIHFTSKILVGEDRESYSGSIIIKPSISGGKGGLILSRDPDIRIGITVTNVATGEIRFNLDIRRSALYTIWVERIPLIGG